MPTIAERYETATAYVRRAISTVENRPFAYVVDPVTGAIEWYAGRIKTGSARSDLERIESRWLRASSDIERARIARDAELLADRVQETLPGAPQDRKRTNLYPGEVQTLTPATSYYGAVEDQAREVAHSGQMLAGAALEGLASVGKWLLVGGSVLLAIKAIGYLRERERRVAPQPTRADVQAALEAAVNARERRP